MDRRLNIEAMRNFQLLAGLVLIMTAEHASAADRFEWERVRRVIVRDSPQRAHYPSVVRAADGTLLVLFTQQTAKQEASGQGDLMLVRSTDDGLSWSDGAAIYRAGSGVPRAMGTMTALGDGRIIAPFVELDRSQTIGDVSLLISEDNGDHWEKKSLNVNVPLAWWAPCGKLVEAADGVLAMPIYGAVSQVDLNATIHHCGLLRSTDGGESWGDFTWIARGGQGIAGADSGSRFSFEGLSVQPTPDGRWLGMMTARRLNKGGDGPSPINEGPGAPQVLCRLWSSDEGRTWTRPDQLMPGAWPSLAVVETQTLCANTLWAAWGEMRLVVSQNGFDTFFQELPLMLRGWLQGMNNRPQEIPLPPTVPYLTDGNRWNYEHFGFPSMLALDADNLIVVFGRTQNGQGHGDFPWDPPEWKNLPIYKERIQAVFYQRKVVNRALARPTADTTPGPRGRWVLAERIVVKGLGPMARAPDGDFIGVVDGKFSRSSDGGRSWKKIDSARFPGEGDFGDDRGFPVGAFGILRSGRWLASVQHQTKPHIFGTARIMGERNGYHTILHEGFREFNSVAVCSSDDDGKTWRIGEKFTGPLQSAFVTACRFIEGPDDTIALPISGAASDRQMTGGARCDALIRSHDGGKTWGDSSFVFRPRQSSDDLQPEPSSSEMDIIALPNGHWVAYCRADRTSLGPKGRGTSPFAVSTDLGRTWHDSGARLAACHQQTGVMLPDGGIAFTFRASSWQGPGVAISYDEGRSFNYMLTGPYETINALLSSDDEFVSFSGTTHRSDSSAGVYRWIPQ